MLQTEGASKQTSEIKTAINVGLRYSEKEDEVDSTYKIDTSQFLPHLSNPYAKYYIANHIESGDEFYAIVFDRGFKPDLKAINCIQSTDNQYFNKPLATSVVQISLDKIKRVVTIVPKYDPSQTLGTYIKQIKTDDLSFLESALLPFLSSVILFCEENKLNCGNICPDNIMINSSKLILREPFISYPHSLQSNYFLAIELSDAEPQGRKVSNCSADIYAAGVTMLYSILGSSFSHESEEKFKKERLEFGSLQALIGKIRLNDDVRNHIKGCMNDNVAERWKVRNLIDWSKGKLPSNKSPGTPEIPDVFAPVSFNGRNYNHHRDLASALYKQWDQGLNFLSEERVMKWIQRSAGKSKAIDALDDLTAKDFGGGSIVSGASDREDRLTRAIIALDPQGPMRSRSLSCHISALANMFFAAYLATNTNIMTNIIKIALRQLWEDQVKNINKEDIDVEMIANLTQITAFYNHQTQGCGIERVLYHFNPDMPCLSPLVYNYYITTLSALLYKLDEIAASQTKMTFDKHIISFIAQKINLKREVYVNILRDIPSNADDLSLYVLSIISLAVKHEPNLKLPNIAKIIARRMMDFIDRELHNVSTKKELHEKLTQAADEVKFDDMLAIVTNPKMYIADQSGYFKARVEVDAINRRISSLSNIEEVRQYGMIFGQRITVLSSYLLLLASSLFMVL
ncbi:MAG: hypothetical protein SFT91_04275 [Rickettsiaceae bacterium]|nr:hypothetical protein [Rickettsiaceae bacterium]